MSGFIDVNEYLAGTIRNLNEVVLTNQQMSSEDEEVLVAPKDIQDESALSLVLRKFQIMKSKCMLRKTKVMAI